MRDFCQACEVRIVRPPKPFRARTIVAAHGSILSRPRRRRIGAGLAAALPQASCPRRYSQRSAGPCGSEALRSNSVPSFFAQTIARRVSSLALLLTPMILNSYSFEDQRYCRRQALPIRHLFFESRAPRLREGVILRPPVVVGSAPLGADPAPAL